MKFTLSLLALSVVGALCTPSLADEGHRYDIDSTQTRMRIISSPFRSPPPSIVIAEIPIVQGPCVAEVKTNWIHGAQVETRSGLCQWADGTIRPTR
jgi:hypothetical protein